MKQKFFDEIDSEWSDLISDVYTNTHFGNYLEFPLNRKKSKYFDVYINKYLSKIHDGKRILDIIIPYNENIVYNILLNDISYCKIFSVIFNRVPLDKIIFRLDDGVEINPSTPEILNKMVSFELAITENNRSKEIDYKLSMCENEFFNRYEVNNILRHNSKNNIIPDNLIDMYSDYNEPVKLSNVIITKLNKKGLNIL